MKKLVLISIIFLIIIGKICSLQINDKNHYAELLNMKTQNYVIGSTAKRGRILDRNGKVLVDNKASKTIFFNNLDNITQTEKIDIAYQLADVISIEDASEINQKKFIITVTNVDLLTSMEKQLYQERKLSNEDVLDLKYSRISLDNLSTKDKKAAQIYYLMNKDYKYVKKEIKRNVTDDEYALVLEKNLKGITGEITWDRVYPYQDILKSIIGSVGHIPAEKKDYYLDKGYSLSDIVGLSYLEQEYDDYLKGEKSIYKVKNGHLMLIKDEVPGNDLYLNIDIDIEKELVNKVQEEMLLAKSKPNTEYFHDLYAAVSEPESGSIIALVGMRYLDNGEFKDITSDIISSSFTVGSVVKAASIAVGYNNNLIEPGKYITDSCVKLYFIPEKCSFKRLGRIDDIKALAFSSNYYQYLIAIGLTNQKYHFNMKLDVTDREFDIYRNTLATYGLGVKTEIDLPNEQTGQKGTKVAGDLLLNLAIGQYDTYTCIQLLQYINTVATGKRYALQLGNKIVKDSELVGVFNPRELNNIEINNSNLERVHLGLQKVISEGTGKTAAELIINPAGKTGTSESFYDSDFDGKVDVKTISTSLALYYPSDNPKYSIAIIAPNISHNNNKTSYTYSITKHISSSITKFLFENY